MPDETSRLNVEIKQTAKGTGIKDTSRDLKQLTAEQVRANKATQATAGAVNQLAEAAGTGASAGNTLASALQGNVASLGQVHNLIRLVSTAIKTSFAGALITLGSLAASFAIPFIAGFKKTREGAEDAKKAITEATEEAERFGNLELENLQIQLAGTEDRANATVAALRESIELAESLASAQDNLDLARIESDGTLSNEERVKRRAAIVERAIARRSTNVVQLAEGEVSARRTARDQAQRAESEAAIAYDSSARAASAPEEAQKEIERLDAALAAARAEILARTRAGTPVQRRALYDLGRADQAKRAAPAAVLDRYKGDAGTALAEQQEAGLAAETKALDIARKASLKSAEELAVAEKRLASIRENQAKVSSIEAETRQIKTGQELAVAKAADQEARLRAEAVLNTSDVNNIAARTAIKLGSLNAPGDTGPLIRRAQDAAKNLAQDEDVTSAETRQLAEALSGLVSAAESIAPRGQTTVDLKAILEMVNDSTKRIRILESQMRNARTLH